MPKKILGQPVDEEAWDKAKRLAAEQGHEGEYDYIMGIYKQMKGLGKSQKPLDASGDAYYRENRDRISLVMSKASLDDFRCPKCNALLLRGRYLDKSHIEVKCRRCGKLVCN